MNRPPLSRSLPLVLLAASLLGGPALAQEDPAQEDPAQEDPAQEDPEQGAMAPSVEERLDAVESENEELRRRLDLMAEEVERFELRDLFVPAGDSVNGFGPAASKVYFVEQGVSIGGYGEWLFESFDSEREDGADSDLTDTFDALRGVLYFGYKFDEHWLLNTEFEFEHASTGEEGSASVEFAYLDYRPREELGFRAGLLLVPMGFLNELHEPTTFHGAARPVTESRILPTTWRENGLGLFGDLGPVAYRTYVVNGLDAEGFSPSGLRGGRQKGSEAKAEDLAWVGRADWTVTQGLVVGGSLYVGDSGQGIEGASGGLGVGTTVAELHGEWAWRGLRLRALYAEAQLDDVAELNGALGLDPGESVGEELRGGYVEVAYDVLTALRPGSRQSLTPFVRFESLDTNAEVPGGFTADPAQDLEVLTVGLGYQPLDPIVFKLDWQRYENGAETGVDRINFGFGYVF